MAEAACGKEGTNERFAEINTDLCSHIESTMCNFIINGFTDAEWDAFIQKCHDLHSDELVEIYQTRYDQFMAS